MISKMNRLGFAIDIDGTLILKGKIITGAREALEKLNKLGIPFVLLTNNTAKSEDIKAKELNQILTLSKPITGSQIILNYTPIKQRFHRFADKPILIIGRQVRLTEIMPLSFIHKYITVDQYVSLFPQAVPLSKHLNIEMSKQTAEIVKQRLQMETLDRHSLEISGILILTVPNQWQESFQVIIDILSTENGTVSKNKSFHFVKNHIPVMAAFNDLSHVTHQHNLPRLLMKPFTESLKAIFRCIYHENLSIEVFGKPQIAVFQYTKRHLESLSGPIDKMVMIGDNEDADIVGAFRSNWDSILVKTGVCQHESKHATINAQNILQGIELYLQKEKY